MEENILLVLSIIEGRHFPKRPHHKLVIEAKFDGEFLTTDLIKHNDNPQFNTELAWEIDKKLLHQHKLQRTPIKLQVYAVESTNLTKELIGYCVLDIRSAQLDGKKKGEWISLLNSKYQSLKPEIKTSLILEIDQVKNDDEQKNKKKVKSMLSNQNDSLEIVLDQENGYYLIGQKSNECKIFVLSVSIGGAKNLIKLLNPTSNISSENGYYFYYSLFGNDVTNETFYDLLSTSIPTERATVRICATSEKLFNYLKKKNLLEIFFCSGENYLGKTTVSLDSLLVDKNFSSSLSLEGMFPILTMSSSSSDAMLGVSIVLKREEVIQEPNVSPVVPTQAQKIRSAPYDANNQKHDFLSAPKIDESQKDPYNEIPLTPPHKPEKPHIKGSVAQIQHHQNHQDKSSEENHHFSFSIDLRSLSNDSNQFPLNVICRYVYSFFGSSSPVITHPPIMVNRGSEVLLPNSFCKFEFASSFQLLQTTFNRVPLLVEIWHKEVNMKDIFIGLAQIRLADVLLNNNTTLKNGPSIKSSRVPVVSADDPTKRIGSIHVVIGLEDHGKVLTKIQVHSSASQTDSVDNTISEHVNSIEPPRKTQEYQVAIALEMWKHQQEELFKEQLQKKENERMKVLAEEWKIRDMEREVILNKKLDEYRTLESKLKTTIQEVESHQKDLEKREVDLASKERLLKEDYNLKANEMQEASKRLKEQCQHQIYLEQLHYSEIEEKYKKVVEQLHEAENKLKERENDIYRLKESMLSRPEVKLQSEMHLLLLEKNELERKIEAVSKSKVHYKQQWGRALRELARLKTGEQEAAKVRLKRQHDELEHMKLRYLAAEENKVIGKERQELNLAKVEITKKLEELEMVRNQSNLNRHRINDCCDENRNLEGNYGTEKSRIAKLIDERDTLLQTGVYTAEDRVINELDKEIQHLISAYR
ncbi:centrosomal protein of 120 kDa isoform X3 [Hydra vulgaris]|uniref:Centrosomal protein of 120 kDa isoform X3 n=1 Tax=Hydra vulgaris TaxID=6087 RepID=A0ABM4DAV8_HYDVU